MQQRFPTPICCCQSGGWTPRGENAQHAILEEPTGVPWQEPCHDGIEVDHGVVVQGYEVHSTFTTTEEDMTMTDHILVIPKAGNAN